MLHWKACNKANCHLEHLRNTTVPSKQIKVVSKVINFV